MTYDAARANYDRALSDYKRAASFAMFAALEMQHWEDAYGFEALAEKARTRYAEACRKAGECETRLNDARARLDAERSQYIASRPADLRDVLEAFYDVD